MLDEILSTLRARNVSDLVYSSLSFYGTRRQTALPGTWFVAALAPLGVSSTAIRQTLYRMEGSGALLSVKRGRAKYYFPSATTRAILEAGRERIMKARPSGWDGQWTVVQFRFDRSAREARDLAREVLQSEGFAALGPGLYIHPRDRSGRIMAALEDMGHSDRVVAFRGRRQHGQSDAEFVENLWNLKATTKDYSSFLRQFQPIARCPVNRWSDQEAFALRFAVVSGYLRISWTDPELPPELQPPQFPGPVARRMTRDLYRRLTHKSLRYGDKAFAEVGGVPMRMDTEEPPP